MSRKKTIKVAAVNSWAEPLAIKKNIAGVKVFLKELEKEEVDYTLFPELSVSGYINSREDLITFSKSVDSVLLDLTEFSKQCKQQFSVGLPLPLRNGYGIAQLTYKGGNLIHTHYKTHLSVHEKEVFDSGIKLHNFNIKDFNTGMQLCLESHYPELSLLHQKQGAELLCFAFASPRETPENKLARLKMILQARAYDNVCFVMACNQTGKTPSGKNYAGTALVLSPRGKILAESIGMKPNYCIAEIDYSEIEKIKNSVMSDFPAYRNSEMTINK